MAPKPPLALLLMAMLATEARAGTPQAPATPPLVLAQAQLSAEDIFWQTVQASTDPAMLQAYLDEVAAGRFSGTYKSLAEIKLAALRKPAPATPPAAPADKGTGRAVIIDEPPPRPVQPPAATAAASPDIEACDRSAAAAADSEKPANVPGVTYASIDASAAIRACRKAIETPDAPRRVFFQLGRAIRKSGNTADAVTFYRKAVELGHGGAMHDLAGVVRSGGQGVKRDPGLAMALYERAAGLGVNESLVQLGAMYVEGRGTRRDYARALDYYQRAIDAKTPGGYTNMGVLYDNGQGVPRSRTRACEYWREGSALGDEVAARNLKRSCRIR